MKNHRKNRLIAASVAGLVAAAGMSIASNAFAGGATGLVPCYGVNACKGAGDCGGKGHACAGKNACKGAGFVSVPKDACAKIAGGTLKA